MVVGLGIAFGGLFGSVAQARPAADRIAEALDRQPVMARLEALSSVGASLSREEILPVVDALGSIRELRAREVLREAIVRRWSSLDPAAAFAFVLTLPPSQSMVSNLRLATTAFARTAPAKAGAAVASMGGGRPAVEAGAIVAEAWARQDAEKAWRWAEALADAAVRKAAVREVSFIWVHTAPARAAGEVLREAHGADRGALLINIAGEWAGRDTPAAIRWAKGLESDEDRAVALDQIAESWADRDPVAAAEFTGALGAGAGPSATVGVAGRWATQDPRAAAQWIETLPDADTQRRAIAALLETWVAVDPGAAAAWISGLKNESARDGAIDQFIDQGADWVPALAMAVARSSGDAGVRAARVERVRQARSAFDSSPPASDR